MEIEVALKDYFQQIISDKKGPMSVMEEAIVKWGFWKQELLSNK